MKDLQTYYEHKEREWRVIVREALSDEALNRIRLYVLDVQIDRLRSLPAGAHDKRQHLNDAIEDLKNHKIAQVVVTKPGAGSYLFSSDASTGKIISTPS